MKTFFFLFFLLFMSSVVAQDNPVFMVDASLVGKWKVEEISVNGKVLTEHQELDEWNITADKRYIMSRQGDESTMTGRWEIKYENVFVFYHDNTSENPHFEVLKIHPLSMTIKHIHEGDTVVFKLARK